MFSLHVSYIDVDYGDSFPTFRLDIHRRYKFEEINEILGNKRSVGNEL